MECLSRFTSSSLVVLHLVVGLKCINSIFPGLYIEEDTFHEFIYFNQYIVCFFNKNMPIAPSNKNVCIKH